MKPAPFAYVAPTSLAEALDVLASSVASAGAGAGQGVTKVLAGGQSLLPLMSMRLVTPDRLVDINRLTELATVSVEPAGAPGQPAGVRIGALARHAAVAADPAAKVVQPLIAEALGLVAHPTIRNRGTTVGSIVHADPAAEMPAVLALLGGTVEAVSADTGRRCIAGQDLYVGPLETALRPDELVTAAWLPATPPTTGTAITEVSRRHGDYALVGVAAAVGLDDDLRVASARAAYFSVDVVPLVLDLTEPVAAMTYDAADWAAAARLAQAGTDPEADIHASADYRRHLVGVLTVRALRSAAARAAGTGEHAPTTERARR